MIESELNQRFQFLIKGTDAQRAALKVRSDGTALETSMHRLYLLADRLGFIHLLTFDSFAQFAQTDMKTKLKGNQRLIDAIVPTKFLVGCRRPTPGNGYLEALNEPNVEVYTEMFREVTEKGFLDHEGKEVEVDVFVCAT